MQSKILACVTILLVCTNVTSAQNVRNLTIKIAPGCKNEQCDSNVYYIKAVGNTDTIHYLWDFTRAPSLLLAYTEVNATVNIDWKRFLGNGSKSVSFSSQPLYSFILQLSELIEYEDPNDLGIITNESKNKSFNANELKWINFKTPELQSNLIFYEMVGSNFEDKSLNLSGSVFFQLSTFGTSDHDLALPRLLHSANSSQTNIILKDLRTNSGFEHTRWALKFVIVSTDLKNGTLEVDTHKIVNDENSPGVFTMVDLMTPNSREKSSHGAFLNWRPVVYTTNTPSIANSSDVGVMEPIPISGSDLSGTLAYKVYGDGIDQFLSDSVVVSFGSSQDGFYKKTNYSSWTFLVSYGSPQIEGLSWLVIMVMSIGLGLPCLLILFGGLFVCIRRCTHHKDELSLER